ncbi:MAG: indole-3-glycerol-phosphate synthase [Candidatus Marinimicrobia bacterium]|nr:indole-3-glycerol-phosphate synthase [Candidatus Neomarinimicrobiota bacterium]
MSDVLANICAIKKNTIAQRKSKAPLSKVEVIAKHTSPVRDFAAALSNKISVGDYALIAEIKKSSPSAGLIRADFNPSNIAAAYEKGGAACLSVLTEEDHFCGHDSHLQQARSAIKMPVLRKDFIIDPYQIAESRAIGADCILLIMAALNNELAAELECCAESFGMAVLIEVHDEYELERAFKLKSRLIGINNRNLKTLQTDLTVTEKLAALIPEGYALVAESGLKTSEDLDRMSTLGVRRFLIGESLLIKKNIESATRALVKAGNANA